MVVIGDRLAGGSWQGCVVGVYPRAIDILRSDGLLVSVVADMDSMTELSVCAPELFASAPACAVGLEANQEGARLFIGSHTTLTLAGCRRWRGSVDGDALLEQVLPRIDAMQETIALCGRAAWRSADPFSAEARTILEHRALHRLVGLGPGLTPAGDDFLAGALMVRRLERWRAGISDALPGTSPAGRTLLWLALRGSFPGYLGTLARRLAGAHSAAEVSDAVRSACAHGETSGSDAVGGLCWAAASIVG